MAKRKKHKENAIENVSFRLTSELMKDLEKFAQNQASDTGGKLTPGQAARRLVILALRQQKEEGNVSEMTL